MWYSLDKNYQPVKAPDILEDIDGFAAYSKWLDKNKVLSRNVLETGEWVSTVFLGLDHSFHEDGLDPILWETMVFKSRESYDSIYTRRYNNYEDARFGHERICQFMNNPFQRKELLNGQLG